MYENEQLIRSLFDAFGRRNLDEAVGLFAEDAVFRVPGRSGISGTYRGHAGVLDPPGGLSATAILRVECIVTNPSPDAASGSPENPDVMEP